MKLEDKMKLENEMVIHCNTKEKANYFSWL